MYQHYAQNGFYASDQLSASCDFLLVSPLHLNIEDVHYILSYNLLQMKSRKVTKMNFYKN